MSSPLRPAVAPNVSNNNNNTTNNTTIINSINNNDARKRLPNGGSLRRESSFQININNTNTTAANINNSNDGNLNNANSNASANFNYVRRCEEAPAIWPPPMPLFHPGFMDPVQNQHLMEENLFTTVTFLHLLYGPIDRI